MADTLDDLLDEAEAKFCRDSSDSSQTAHTFETKQRPSQQKNKSFTHRALGPQENKAFEDHIDAVLQEILDDDYQASVLHAPVSSKACLKESSPQRTLKRCCPVFLGGSLVQFGIGTSITERACDQMRCISCDFRVITFDDYEWDSSCDYLFLRNNMPDHNKLRVKLKRRQGARAYACQCSWHSAFTLSELRHIQQLKWICGQHKA